MMKMRAAAGLAGAVILGLAARYGLAGFAAKYLGVALWASAAYFLILFIAPKLKPTRAAIAAAVFSFAIEFFQLTPVPAWLSGRWIVFRWIFGTTFSVYDLPAYLAGVIAAAAVHYLLSFRRS